MNNNIRNKVINKSFGNSSNYKKHLNFKNIFLGYSDNKSYFFVNDGSKSGYTYRKFLHKYYNNPKDKIFKIFYNYFDKSSKDSILFQREIIKPYNCISKRIPLELLPFEFNEKYLRIFKDHSKTKLDYSYNLKGELINNSDLYIAHSDYLLKHFSMFVKFNFEKKQVKFVLKHFLRGYNE